MLIHPQFDPVAIQLGPLAIRWYGLMYLIGFVTLWLLGRRRIKTQPWNGFTAKELEDLIFYGVLGVVLGGRLGYVLFYKPEYYFAHPLEIFAVWQGGMAFHGGFLGVLAAAWWFGWRAGKGFLQIMDFVAPLVPIGLALGRLGNLFNADSPGVLPKCPGAWCSRKSTMWFGTPRSFIKWGSRASACLWFCGSSPQDSDRVALYQEAYYWVTGASVLLSNTSARPTIFSDFWRSGFPWVSG